MTTRSKSRWRSLAPALLALLGAFVYFFGTRTFADTGLPAAKTGVVLDARTRQPLADVYVVARWLEQTSRPGLLGGGKVEGQCLYRVVVRTDTQGKYLIPAIGKNFKAAGDLLPDRSKKYFWDLYTYSSGYDVITDGRPPPAIEDLSADDTQTLEPILLAVDNTSAERRVSALADTLSRFTCEPYSTEPLPIAQQVYAEAYATACLPEPTAAASALARLRRGVVPVSAEDAGEPCMQFRQANNQVQ